MRNYTTGKCNMQCFYTTRSRKILYKIVIFSLCFHMSSEFHDKSGESNKNLEGGRQRDKLEWGGGGGGGVGMSSIRLNQRPSSFRRCLSCYVYSVAKEGRLPLSSYDAKRQSQLFVLSPCISQDIFDIYGGGC